MTSAMTQSGGEAQQTLPMVTVIMPIRNEADFITRSLGAVLTQDYPHECLEVVIADGMSTDRTRALIAEAAARQPDVSVTIVDNPKKIVPTGFNLALARAAGDVIVRVDGHTIIEPDYVSKCVSALQRSGADNVGGKMSAVGTTPFGEAVALATSSPFGVGGARFHYLEEQEWVDTVYMGAWPREVFNRIGAFDEEMVRNQDDEFNYRLLANDGRILLSPDIKSRYYNRPTLRSLWRQYFQYGFWKVRVAQKHPAQLRPRQLVPPGFALSLLFFGILAPFLKPARVLLAFVAAVYALANLGASIKVARKEGPNHLRLLPIVFGTLHLSYGLGFLYGVIRFWRLWNLPYIDTSRTRSTEQTGVNHDRKASLRRPINLSTVFPAGHRRG